MSAESLLNLNAFYFPAIYPQNVVSDYTLVIFVKSKFTNIVLYIKQGVRERKNRHLWTVHAFSS